MMYIKPKRSNAHEEKLPKSITEMPLLPDLTPNRLGLRGKFLLVFLSGSTAIIILVVIALQGVLSFQKWHDNWYFAEHKVIDIQAESGYKNKSVKVTFSLPITIEKREQVIMRGYEAITGTTSPETIKVLTQEEKERVVASSGLSKIIRGVWELETNSGRNTNGNAHHNECSAIGMTNEFGFRALDDYCFDTFENSVARVTEWFEGELRTKSLNQALCYYASGRSVSTCEYAISFAKLDADGKLASN